MTKAKRFIDYAQENFQETRYDAAAFYAQQAAEMLLKGILLRKTGARPYTHSVSEMLKTLAQTHDKEVPEPVLVSASKLERHYLSSRYPDLGMVEYNRWDAEEALQCLKEVLRFVDDLGEDY